MSKTRRDLIKNTALAAGAAALLTKTAKAEGEQKPIFMDLFPKGWRNERIKTTGAEINAVIGGSGPPVLMFHGAPQSLITWRIIAPDLAKDYTLVLCDLRGYGDSSKPADGDNHSNYSKRPMALDGVEVMEHLGFRQFRMVGHDRGGRVGTRMALDHPDRVQKLAVLDIIPAWYLYSHVNLAFVRAYPHWFNDLLPSPKPENDIKAQNEAQLARATDPVQKEYLRTSATPEAIHAMCEDYRASASIDLDMDNADLKAGKKIQCPLIALWADKNQVNHIFNPMDAWSVMGVNVKGKALPGSHSLQESAPKETLAELQAFLKG
jgi:haloacetate dehalogenase